MSTARKPQAAPKAATPSASDADAAKARGTASAVPSGLMESAAVPEHWSADGEPLPGNPLLDPGPPPAYPHPPRPALWSLPVTHELFNAGRMVGHESALEAVRAVDVLRQPPGVQQYKAEVLAWLDAREAYRRQHGS
jgi:hypothetical protein